MAELATVSSMAQPLVGVCRLIGRIQGKSRKHENVWYTVVTLPASDAFSHPAVVEVRSSERLGSDGEDVDIKVRVGGFNRKPYDFTDKATGETRRVVPNNVTLDVI